jgi:hypothetical protein
VKRTALVLACLGLLARPVHAQYSTLDREMAETDHPDVDRYPADMVIGPYATALTHLDTRCSETRAQLAKMVLKTRTLMTPKPTVSDLLVQFIIAVDGPHPPVCASVLATMIVLHNQR